MVAQHEPVRQNPAGVVEGAGVEHSPAQRVLQDLLRESVPLLVAGVAFRVEATEEGLAALPLIQTDDVALNAGSHPLR